MEQTQTSPVLKRESIWTPQRKYKRYSKKYSTYLGLIAHVIQNSPNKMLTFGQLMESLNAFVSGERKGLENNVRVCLSSNDCFVKVPVNPEYPNARRNYWKVDERRITPKMLRRHFSGTRDILTGSSCRIPVESDPLETVPKSTEMPAVLESKRFSKFSSSFSIESLLRKEPEVCHTSTLPTDASVNDNLLRKACSLGNPFGLDTNASFRDFQGRDINTYTQYSGFVYKTPREAQDNESFCIRARLSPPIVMYPAANVSPLFNHERMVALRRWSHGVHTFDSRSF